LPLRSLLGQEADHARQLPHGFADLGHVLANALEERPRPDLLVHPAAEHRPRGFPQVELRIELAAQPFDIEQRLLQQYQLWLYFHVEASRRIEKPHRDLREGYLGERLAEDGFADRSHGRLEFVYAGVGWYPAGVDVQFRDGVVV